MMKMGFGEACNLKEEKGESECREGLFCDRQEDSAGNDIGLCNWRGQDVYHGGGTKRKTRRLKKKVKRAKKSRKSKRKRSRVKR